jgi:hypothetical protein
MRSLKWALLILLLGVMLTGYGGLCGKEDSGSSGVTVAAPSLLVVTKPAANIMLTWQDNSDNETSFVLYVRAYNATEWTVVSGVIPASATSYSFPAADLGAGSNFQFCLTAYNSPHSSESGASNIFTLSW